MAVTMRQLLESGVHFGHQTRRWNPKMKRFIFTERNGIYIIDLRQTLDYIEKAYEFVRNTVAEGGTILFVGTKKQAQEAIAEQAQRVGHAVRQPPLARRHADQLPDGVQAAAADEGAGGARPDRHRAGYTKKETLQLSREKAKLTRTLGGLRDMQKLPAAIWVVDTKKEHIAVDEARKLGIPVIAVLDTNCDPDEVDFPIPGNDDAIRSAALLTRVVADAVADGLIARSGKSLRGDDKPQPGTAAVDEPLAEWERELAEGAAAQCGHGRRLPAPLRPRPRLQAPVVATAPTEAPVVAPTEAPVAAPAPALRPGDRSATTA